MDWFNLFVTSLALLGAFLLIRVITLLSGVFLSKLVTGILILALSNGLALLAGQNLVWGTVIGSLIYLIGEVFLGFYSALNLFFPPQNPGDSLRSILVYNFTSNTFKDFFILAVAGIISVIFIPFRDPTFQERISHWALLTTPLVRYLFAVLGLLFLLKGISMILFARRTMESPTRP